MACSRYLGFEPTDIPLWRKDLHNNRQIPTVSEMVKQILQYKEIWTKIRRDKRKNIKKYVSETNGPIKLNFGVNDHVMDLYVDFYQIGEDIGVHNRDTFNDIAYDENCTIAEEKRGIKRRLSISDNGNTLKQKCTKSSSLQSLEDKLENNTLSSSQNSNESANTDGNENSGSLSSNDSLPSSQDVQGLTNSQTEQAKKTEAINLLRGYRHLTNELKKIPKEERSGYLGIIDVEFCIKKCHEVLMKDLLDKDRTAAGKFSVLPRSAEFEGKLYFYPSYRTEEVAYDAIQPIVDQYNTMIVEVSKIEHEEVKLKNSFKCASVLLFSFLILHPFSDGNGRLARLLCNHCLKVFCPFPTAIYNMFSPSTRSDYLRALVTARGGLNLNSFQLPFSNDAIAEALSIMEQKPSDLCSLIIESNWFTWRHFLRKIGERVPLLNFEH